MIYTGGKHLGLVDTAKYQFSKSHIQIHRYGAVRAVDL